MITTNLTDLPGLPQEIAYCLETKKSTVALTLQAPREDVVCWRVCTETLLSIRLEISMASSCLRYSRSGPRHKLK